MASRKSARTSSKDKKLAAAKAVLSKYQTPADVVSLSSSAASTEARRLPATFQPGPHDVVCGRGKGSYNSVGNIQFRALVKEYIPRYHAAKSKIDKTVVLACIVDKVRAEGNFCAHKNGGWVEISEMQAREKTGHAIREAISSDGKKREEQEHSRSGERHDVSPIDGDQKLDLLEGPSSMLDNLLLPDSSHSE